MDQSACDGPIDPDDAGGYVVRAMASRGIGPGFGDVDSATDAAADFIGYLDAARGIALIAQAKQWSFDQLALASGHTALDIGCGTGEDVVAMAALVAPDGRAMGVDASAAMVAEAIKRHSRIGGVAFQHGDALSLPFDSATFAGGAAAHLRCAPGARRAHQRPR